MRKLAAVFIGLLLCTSCNYLKYSKVQADYRRLQTVDPSQLNVKHLIDRQNFAVIGRLVDPNGAVSGDTPMVLAAFSSRFKPDEMVAENHLVRVGSHFGLDLPEGDYEIVVFADRNGDRRFAEAEAISRTSLSLTRANYPSMVVPEHLVELGAPTAVDWDVEIPVPAGIVASRSLFYPVGALRSLDDPIFSRDMSTLGQYDPASFLEQFPTMFYALEEDLVHKVPVIFVHGINGSPREFQTIVDQLDRERFKPWFFYYPSGGDLSQMGRVFHDVFLSGETISIDRTVPIVIVAHSMGGLVVREAMNIRSTENTASSPIEFISLASPFGGHPAARMAETGGGLVLPSWRDINPDNAFIQKLYRQPLPDDVRHHLFYGFSTDGDADLESSNDGVVPLWSQLHDPARQQSATRHENRVSHTAILHDPNVAQDILDILATVKLDAPDDHAAYVRLGGYEVEASAGLTERERYLLANYGRYIQALADGEIQPANASQEALVPMLRGEARPEFDAARAWRKFVDSGALDKP